MPRKPRACLTGQLQLPLPKPERLDPLLGRLTRRLGAWAWVETWERVQRKEPVTPFHKGLMRATLARLSGRGPRPENHDD
jgi:hypothetical protein